MDVFLGNTVACLLALAVPSLPADDFKSTAASPGLGVKGLTTKGHTWVQQHLWDVFEPPPGMCLSLCLTPDLCNLMNFNS